jgi:ABC-type branched-subunit amino acid transport system substrate-binding protein
VRRLTDAQDDPKEAAAVARKFASDGSILAVLYACAIECGVRTG